ncbi:PIR Superfamily Protein [Plasmodium ovale wallikeri]|uniref:PIR Superfamily Protein n=1 Tax=Plasmodium ovale wallikeri TaxID=864142 RepID=A0A1A9ARN4_PLAOA|nr:PIR Superfamily Protein [Plasmodium ovale wallikeri]
MTKGITIDDLPSKKYKNELEIGINYQDIEENIESNKLATDSLYWSTTVRNYLEKYIYGNIDKWSGSNYEKRCRDFNYILDIILKKIKEKEKTNSDVPYSLFQDYIDEAAKSHLKTWEDEYKCIRDSKIPKYSDDIENMKNIDDLCEDIAYIEKNVSKIHSNNCKQIESYIDQQITNLKPIYTSSSTKYSDILGYYGYTSFDKIDNIAKDFKSKCQEGTTGASLAGYQGGMPQNTGKNASIIAVTSLSGILSSFFLLYKTTSFGSILNNLVGKKIKFGNNLRDKSFHETLEDISESSHGEGYNILYNSLGDS